jgi:hypothetical protein
MWNTKEMIEFFDGLTKATDGRIFKSNGEFVCEIRGWGKLIRKFNSTYEAAKFQDGLSEFISDAINEKIEKEIKTRRQA